MRIGFVLCEHRLDVHIKKEARSLASAITDLTDRSTLTAKKSSVTLKNRRAVAATLVTGAQGQDRIVRTAKTPGVAGVTSAIRKESQPSTASLWLESQRGFM